MFNLDFGQDGQAMSVLHNTVISGGEVPGPPPLGKSNVRRFDFSSDLLIDTSADSHPHQRGTGVSSNYHGYFSQGQSEPGFNTSFNNN